MCTPEWTIGQPLASNFLKDHRDGGSRLGELVRESDYSIFAASIRSDGDIAEFAAAIGAKGFGVAEKLAVLSFQRLVLFETVAAIETNLKFEEEQLLGIVQSVYRHCMKDKPVFTERQNQLQTIVMNRVRNDLDCLNDIFILDDDVVLDNEAHSEDFKHLLEMAEKIKHRLLTGQYKPAMIITDLDSEVIADQDTDLEESVVVINQIAVTLAIKIHHDKLLMRESKKQAREYVDERLNTAIDNSLIMYPGTEQVLEKLSLPVGNKRHTIMLAGAPACGKGTITAMLIVMVKQRLGIDWRDMIKINTDLHRVIVSSKNSLGPNPLVHSALNNFEASLITDMAYDRIEDQLANGCGHHLVIDGVNPTSQRMQLGLSVGHLHVAAVTLPTEKGLYRAYARAQKDGRYVASSYQIKGHIIVSRDLIHNMIASCGGLARASLEIFDTDVPYGEQPIKLMTLNMSNGWAVIHDLEGMAKFYAKKDMNPNAKSVDELFPEGVANKNFAFLEALGQNGIDIEYDSESDCLKAEAFFKRLELQQRIYP